MVYNWFAVLKEKYNADVVAYVIMPNHVHIIAHFHKEGFNLNTIVANGKRFMAYEMINRLEIAANSVLLNHLKTRVTAREKKKGQLHKVFKDSFDAKAIYSHKFLMQKINYITILLVESECWQKTLLSMNIAVHHFMKYSW